jgi:DNA mismatch repair protein MutS
MKKYIKNYLKHYNIGEQDIIQCAICGAIAQDIHHIKYKSQGGSDEVDNLIALCRQHHEQAHDNILTKEYLYDIKTK